MRVSRRWVLIGGVFLLAAFALPAAAQSGKADAFNVTVLLVSPNDGEVDGRAQRFDRILRKRLRYESLRFVSSSMKSVAEGSIGTVPVPGAGAFRFRPISGGGEGVLVAVEWGSTRGDFRIRRGRPLILGGPRSGDGELVVVLESR